ncbi:MAG: zf-HC2 domain-containing protein [Thermoanaerobaculum sp.]
MSCQDVRGQLAAYALEALGEGERARVRAHLRSCSACRALLWRQDPSLAMAVTLEVAEPRDERFVDDVLAGIHQRRVERALARKKRLRRMAAAAVVAAALGAAYFRPAPRPQVAVTAPVPAHPPEPFVEVEGEGVRVYQLATEDSRVQVAFIVSPSVEL